MFLKAGIANGLINKAIFTKGVRYLLLSTLCFTVMQALIKYQPKFHSFQHIFFRSVIGWVFCIIVLLYQRTSLIGKNNSLLIFRGIIGSVSMFCFFYILTNIPFGSAVAFKYLSPVFTAIFAVFLLKEKIKVLQWFFFLISFAGVVLLKGFDTRISFFDVSIGLVSAISGGLLLIIIRKIGDDDHPLVILHYFMMVSAVLSSIAVIPYWVTPNFNDCLWFLLIGTIGFVAQLYFTKAIQQPGNEISFLAIIRYTEVLFALLIGYIFFDEIYSAQGFTGIFLIFTGLILSFRLKSKLRKEEIVEE
ncbi:MAG: DMT family transporter [Ferruginibacter sp.]